MWRTDQARSHEVVAVWCGYRPFAGGVGWADFGILPYPKLIPGSHLEPLLRLIASTAKQTDRIRNDAADFEGESRSPVSDTE